MILGKNHVFRFTHPDHARERREKNTAEIESVEKCADMERSVETADWDFAQIELLEKQGIDLKAEMAKKLLNLEEQYRKEKDAADQLFEEQRKVLYVYL